MFERYTERARQVVILAQEESRRQKVGYIGCEQVLLGIVREEEGLAAKVLSRMGVTVDKVRESADKRMRSHEHEDGELEGQIIPFTPRAKAVFEKSLREALSLGHNYIGTEHVLLGLISVQGNIAVEILRDDFSLSPEQVRQEVLRMLSGPKAPILKKDAGSMPAEIDSLPIARNGVRELMALAVTLGRQHPDTPGEKIVAAALALGL